MTHVTRTTAKWTTEPPHTLNPQTGRAREQYTTTSTQVHLCADQKPWSRISCSGGNQASSITSQYDLQDSIAVEIDNTFWAMMDASQPSWHVWIRIKSARRYEYGLVSAEGSILVGDIVCVVNKAAATTRGCTRAGDREPWPGVAFPGDCTKEGRMAPEQIRD